MRFGTPDDEGEYGVTKQQVLAERNATLTPALTAAMTLSYCSRDQYSSWPTERNALARSSPLGSACVSVLEQ